MKRAPQLTIIVCAGALLFVASQWPRYAVPACILTLIVIWIAVARARPAGSSVARKRNVPRRIAAALIAAALLIWVLLSLRGS